MVQKGAIWLHNIKGVRNGKNMGKCLPQMDNTCNFISYMQREESGLYRCACHGFTKDSCLVAYNNSFSWIFPGKKTHSSGHMGYR